MRTGKLLIVLLIAMVSAAGGAGLKIQSFLQPDAGNIKETIEYDEASGNVNILVMGIDDVEGIHRSDTIAFCTVDIDNKIVRFMSIPRDTRVQIEGHGWQKINHAYAFGQEKLLEKTVVNYLGMPVNYFMIVNYQSFPEIVDLMGGVDVNVSKRLSYTDNAAGLRIRIDKGVQHMDGRTALNYVRFRHDALGDIGRVKRQQKFLSALLDKAKSPAMITELPSMAKKLLKLVNSNMSPAQAIQLASYLKDIPRENMMFFTLPGKAAYISKVSYWIGDISEASTLLSSMPGKKQTSPEDSSEHSSDPVVSDIKGYISSIRSPVAVLNGDGTSGLGKKASDYLQKLGIDVAYTGNAKHFDYKYSNVVYPANQGEDKVETAISLGKIFEIGPKLVREDNTAPYATIILGHDYNVLLDRLKNLNEQQ